MKVRDIPLEKIFITKNVRFETDDELGELIDSLNKHGQLQPIGVYPRGERFELVWGHRRFRAAKMNNESTIAANILQDISEADIPLLKLQENTVRKQLTDEEIVAVADEIKKRRPELSDQQIDRLLGKNPGYLSYHRSMLRTYQWLAAQGLKKAYLRAMTGDELRELKAKIELGGKKRKINGRKSTFHRGDRTPAKGFEIFNPKGPNVVVVCATSHVKGRVIRALRSLARGSA